MVKNNGTTRRGFKTLKGAELALARMKFEISKGTFGRSQAETYQEKLKKVRLLKQQVSSVIIFFLKSVRTRLSK
ncbi:Arm DNA-binding domain-containing protein [Paenisporosarcina indica]|uniref:Arm DNA-binding domain-containing protein n=1 Tax=Paenisporosarcina indica TaxID=650093 RepID=UPI001FE38514|nr:Arm DNA-binding domain-containing protein [Paenisporosarcina indica]